MKAEQFIKDHGLERARSVVEGAPEEWADIYLDALDEHAFIAVPPTETDDFVLISDLKCLVESVDLVEKEGGIDFAIQLLTWGDTSVMTEEHGNRLSGAVRDYESIYGEGNE